MTIICPRDGSDDLLVRLPIEIAKLPLATFVGIEVEPERAIHTAVVRADDEEDVRVDQLVEQLAKREAERTVAISWSSALRLTEPLPGVRRCRGSRERPGSPSRLKREASSLPASTASRDLVGRAVP